MKAHYLNGAGDVRIIRPFVYVRERLTREFAETSGLPVITENCPACFEGPKERSLNHYVIFAEARRYRIKTLLAQQESLFPSLMGHLLRTMKPLMVDSSFEKIARKDRVQAVTKGSIAADREDDF